MRLTTILLVITFAVLTPVSGQVASGGSYTLDQSVIANGGGTSVGGTLKIEGTTGQSVAGQQASKTPFSVHAGFWIPLQLGTTAASVGLSGRVTTTDGLGIRNARVTVVTGDGIKRVVVTGPFGYFAFDGLTAGDTCLVTVSARRFSFAEPTRVVSLTDAVSGLVFVAMP